MKLLSEPTYNFQYEHNLPSNNARCPVARYFSDQFRSGAIRKFVNQRYFTLVLERINMLEAKNLQDSLLPLIYVSIPFGVAPRLPTLGKTLQFLSLVFSLVAVAFGVIAIAMLILVSINLISNDQLRGLIRDVPSQLTCWSSAMAIMASVVTHLPYRRNNTFANIIETLARIDEALKIDKARYYRKTKKVLCAIVIVIPMLLFTFLVCTSYRYNYSWESYSHAFISVLR